MAAGLGTRMRPLTNTIPKPLLTLRGKPILQYTLDFLPKDIDEVIIVINYLGKQIKKHFGDNYGGRKIKYVFQKELNGTGGAVYACKDLLKGTFLVLNGDDIFYYKDLKAMIEEKLAILAFEVSDSSQFGVLKTDEKGNLVEIMEKPHPEKYKLVNTGVYALNEKFFDYDLVPISETEFGLPQTLAKMTQDYPVKILKATRWQTIGNPDEYKKAEEELDKFLE